jgi:hypothetical protein
MIVVEGARLPSAGYFVLLKYNPHIRVKQQHKSKAGKYATMEKSN